MGLSADPPPALSPEQVVNYQPWAGIEMNIKNPQSKENLINRLRRIEGQLRGVQAMLDEERDCREIMQQLSAISSAVRSTSRTFFQDYAALCLKDMDQGNPGQNQKLLQEMLALLDKTP